MTITKASDVSTTTNVHVALDMLDHAEAEIVLDRMAKQVAMPRNKNETIKWRRPIPYTAKTVPLQEGVTPTATTFGYESEQATLQQYGDVTIITDKIDDTSEHPVIKDASMMCGENIGRTREALIYGTVKAGTGVSYANGAARASVNTAISLNGIRGVVRTLRANKAKKITKVVGAGPNTNTYPIAPAYIAVCHSDVSADIRNLPGFVPCEEYSSRNLIHPNELGKVEEVRFVVSADLGPWEDAGGAKGSMVSTTGTSADVYPVLFFGADAYAAVSLKGRGDIEPTIIPPGEKTKDDPLGQRGYIGWKTYHASTILNDAWMHRLEVSVTAL